MGQTKRKKHVLASLGICGGFVPRPPQIPRFTDAQVPYIKWPRIAGPPHPRMQNAWQGRVDSYSIQHSWQTESAQ